MPVYQVVPSDPYLPFVMFALGAVFGVTFAMSIGLAVWRRVVDVYRLETRTLLRAEFVAGVRRLAMSIRPDEAERSTVELKAGVLPFTERPTLVHETSLPGVRDTDRLPVRATDPLPVRDTDPLPVRGTIELDVHDVMINSPRGRSD
jgi:hypothetical protein